GGGQEVVADALCQQLDYAERERRGVRSFRAGADGGTHGKGDDEPDGRRELAAGGAAGGGVGAGAGGGFRVAADADGGGAGLCGGSGTLVRGDGCDGRGRARGAGRGDGCDCAARGAELGGDVF